MARKRKGTTIIHSLEGNIKYIVHIYVIFVKNNKTVVIDIYKITHSVFAKVLPERAQRLVCRLAGRTEASRPSGNADCSLAPDVELHATITLNINKSTIISDILFLSINFEEV